MKKRPVIKRRPLKPPPTRHIIVISLFLFMIFTLTSILIVNEKIKPVMLTIARYETNEIVNEAMGIAVSKKISEDLSNELVKVKYNDQGDPVNYMFNTVVENRVQRNVQYRLQNYLSQIEKGIRPDPGTTLDVELENEETSAIESVKEGPLLEIPLGQAMGIPLLANLGPKIPVNLDISGYASTEVQGKFEPVGVNGGYIIVQVHVEVEATVVIPFASEPAKFTQDIPVTRLWHPGEVPDYFFDGQGGGEGQSSPDVSIPLDPLP
ncbi:sporulation protein YunB [Aquibacillus kalidii]|uniref:sporulation protein YunB n=1 Tax=Aquibacillus kalidii TaxID=2762597 RepID=UPI0016460051|nr:sporulation protein YunB [Aquibacillus kalidii]